MSLTFLSDTRLYQLSWQQWEGPELSVEAWWGKEALSSGFEYVIDLLSTDAGIKLKSFLGQAVTLITRLSDGSDFKRTGYIRTAHSLGADGGFARYRIVVVPWIWMLSRGQHHRVFQEKSVIDIVETVFKDYADIAAWQWGDEVASFLNTARARSYCVQYNESDYAFVSRLLAEEGIGWYVLEDEAASGGHRLQLFANSRLFEEDVVSKNANGGAGIRYHRADSQEEQDAILAFGEHARFNIASATQLSFDYKAKSSVTSVVPTQRQLGGKNALHLEHYDDAGPYAWADGSESNRYGELLMESVEVRCRTWHGDSTVRSLRPGFYVDVTGLPERSTDQNNHSEMPPHRYHPDEVLHVGINNLPMSTMQSIADRLSRRQFVDDMETLSMADTVEPLAAPIQLPAKLLTLAKERGYGNSFKMYRAALPWRPQLVDETGACFNPRPTVFGPMSAIVVGPEGETRPNGAGELWCDALNRIKIRFHWQQGAMEGDKDSCWVRVVSRQAGAGMGQHWLPRIGQEVLVGFLGNDIDRPIVLGALYNGQGEGGIAPTPGGEAATSDTTVFDAATDHAPSAQSNLVNGHSPAWHGGAEQSHRHPAALSGVKTKEFGGSGYNQLVFDDTDNQQRIQLKSTAAMSELNLGHLIHQADNYRGSFRGTGVELRTDAYGAIRGGRGVLMTTWPHLSTADPAGDISAGIALLNQADNLANSLSQAAGTHQTVKLAAAIGTTGANQSKIDPTAAPIKALHTVAKGMVDGADEATAIADAQAKSTNVSATTVPHFTDPAIIQTAKAGLSLVAGQELQWLANESITLASGKDSNFAIANQARFQTGQSIGLLAGAVSPGDNNTGISLIAGKDDITLQAQSDEMKFQSKQDMKLVSVSANIDFAAAKKIHIAVAGGASITIDGGITFECPGTITVHASQKTFTGPTRANYILPEFTNGKMYAASFCVTDESGKPAPSHRYLMTMPNGEVRLGETNTFGQTYIAFSEAERPIELRLLDGDDWYQENVNASHQEMDKYWD